jgi:hypothetical protein
MGSTRTATTARTGFSVGGRRQPRAGSGRGRDRNDVGRFALAAADAQRSSDASAAAQHAELKRRVAALSAVLVDLARDLAGARRDAAVLRAENERLRARLAGLAITAPVSSARAAEPRSPRREA